MPPITSVAAIGHKLSELPRFSGAEDEAGFPLHVLLILVGRGIAAESIDNHVNTFVLRHLVDEPDVILLRVHPTQAEDVLHEVEDSIGLRNRFEGRAIGVLTLTTELKWVIRWVAGISPSEALPPIGISNESLIKQA